MSIFLYKFSICEHNIFENANKKIIGGIQMNLTKKIVITAAVGLITTISYAQSEQDGINFEDSQKYPKAKQKNRIMRRMP